MSETEDGVEQALVRFRTDTNMRWIRFVGSAIFMALSVGIGGIGLYCRLAGLRGGTGLLAMSAFCVVCAALCISGIRQIETRIIDRVGGLRAAGALVERMEISFGSERRAVVDYLVEILHGVEPRTADEFSQAQLTRLNLKLQVPDFVKDEALLVAILHAYARVGTAECVPPVEALASQPGESEAESRVRDAARKCLPSLRQRVERIRTGADLLRASSTGRMAGTDASPDTLLRAASEDAQTPSEELLRAGNPPDQSPSSPT